ncbi:MAG TPA: hypothetical protein VMC41_01415 [Candidatus Nanoarchaeia archaeon]|nr:hypothetical protein [Candidatus Nanoarchaeia archaeon]
MKISVNKKRLNLNPDAFLRKAGYAHIHDSITGHDSYVRRFTRDFYPRFHMYFENLSDRVIFNLHLDQKKASYEGAHMHNAEYDSEIVADEMERLKGFLIEESSAEDLSIDKPEETLDKTFAGIGNRDFRDEPIRPKEKKGWWRIFF